MIQGVQRRRRSQLSFDDLVYRGIAYGSLAFMFMIVVLPLLNFVAISMSGQTAVVSSDVLFWPVDVTFRAYEYVLSSSQFYTSFQVSVIVTVVGTGMGIVFAVSAAYPLSKRGLPGRRMVTFMFVFTMLFNVGIIPNYLLIRNLGLLNSLGALIFPQIVNVFNLLVVKAFFDNLPIELEESAQMDGASYLTVLWRIVIPVAKPALATIALFYAVGYWNDYFHARFYITSRDLQPIQLYLRTVIFEAMDPTGEFALDQENIEGIDVQTVINTTVVVSMIPIIVVYPFLQRYFVKGIMLGSVKG